MPMRSERMKEIDDAICIEVNGRIREVIDKVCPGRRYAQMMRLSQQTGITLSRLRMFTSNSDQSGTNIATLYRFCDALGVSADKILFNKPSVPYDVLMRCSQDCKTGQPEWDLAIDRLVSRVLLEMGGQDGKEKDV